MCECYSRETKQDVRKEKTMTCMTYILPIVSAPRVLFVQQRNVIDPAFYCVVAEGCTDRADDSRGPYTSIVAKPYASCGSNSYTWVFYYEGDSQRQSFRFYKPVSIQGKLLPSFQTRCPTELITFQTNSNREKH